MTITNITTYDAPLPGGHYSQAVVADNLILVSGQLPMVALTGEKITGGISDQTLQALRNVLSIVKAAGGDITTIVRTTIYTTDVKHWEEINRVYADFFGPVHPARSIITVGGLHHGFLVEIEAVAFVK
ncbi:MAG: Rid family detoxifying hydrolase [Bacteroidales bacterium]|nr:Rid family detoxifying hydrolase [Bacteroidales bacterium]MDT8374552.1 Rid family detoxifying hydrolase [Bacteroidales bacterium]